MHSLRDQLIGLTPPGEKEASILETHISWVVLTANEAIKVKKPVSLGFLDFSTLELRKAACNAEVELNRRLARDVYLGVEPIREVAGKLVLGAATGPIIEWAVRMRRLDDAVRADVRLGTGELTTEQIEALALHLAEFHRTAPARTDLGPTAVATDVEENFEQTRATIGRYLEPHAVGELVTWQRRFLATNAELFTARARAEHVRDGHGDLRLEHVYFCDDGIRVLDCIEFDERYRVCDVASDIAFLSMDLRFSGRADLAERLLSTYARESGDYALYQVVDFYESYRAFVRGKVCAILASDGEALPVSRDRADHDARRYFMLALSAGHRPLVEASVTAVGGLIGAGKSTVGGAFARALQAPLICADRTRKQMLGVPAFEHLEPGAFEGAYSPEFTARVYAEVLRRAEHVLASGRPVVIDASFRAQSMRDDVRALAARFGAPFRFVECRAPRELLEERLRAREARPEVSDARLSVLDDFAARFEPAVDVAAGEHIVVDTSRPLADTLRALSDVIATWPPTLNA